MLVQAALFISFKISWFEILVTIPTIMGEIFRGFFYTPTGKWQIYIVLPSVRVEILDSQYTNFNDCNLLLISS